MTETGYQQAILYLLGQDTGGKRLVRCVAAVAERPVFALHS